jgi:inhibitor of cysteine peptidase
MNKRQLISILIIAVSVILFFVLFFGIRGAEDDRIIEATAGRSFTITLDSNPSTGYQWEISKQPDRSMLELVDTKYIPSEIEIPGAPGKEEWTFKTIKTGKAIISFDYVRPWEKDELPVQTESFIIIIR